LLGLLLIGTLNNGLILIEVQAYWQQVVRGAILLAAVFWDEIRRTRRDEPEPSAGRARSGRRRA
jgi:ribose/xylose/arabinose/galactoside ABC-type transport system permease subunit